MWRARCSTASLHLANAPLPGDFVIRDGRDAPYPMFSVSPQRGDGAPGGARVLRYGSLDGPACEARLRTHGDIPVTGDRRYRGARGQ